MKKIVSTSVTAIGLFLMFSCGGNSTAPMNNAPANTASAAVSGEALYKKTCIACHQENGQGIASTFPPLAKSDFLSNKELAIGQVIKGKSGELMVNGIKYNNVMPPQQLNDEEIAAVLTYVYSNFGNSGAPVTTAEVKSVRAKLN